MWDENSVHVFVHIRVQVRSPDFFEGFAVKDQNEARLARVGVDNGC